MSAEQAMQELSSQKAIAPENVLVRELSGEAVLLNLDSEMYFGLDEVGYRMWTLLTTCDCVNEAYQQLLSEYDVDSEQLWESLEALIAQCNEQGLLHLAPRS
jgi:hypothetical protein